MPELPLVGRERELAAVERVIDAAIAGSGGAALITGEPGVGKTRLLLEAQKVAKDRGLVVLRGRAVEDSGAYRPLVEALSRPSAQLVGEPRLAGVRPILAPVLPSWMGAAEAAGTSMADPAVVLAEAILQLINVLAPRGALLLLDDLHWADNDTLAVLRYLADTAEELPLALVLASRGHPSLPPQLTQMVAARSVEQVQLHRLTSEQVTALLAAAKTPGVDVDTIEQMARAADGLPLIVDELVRHLREATDAAAVIGTVPGSVAAAVQHRLITLTPPSRAVLDALAVLGETDPALLMAATGLDRETVAHGLRDGLQSTLLVPSSTASGVQWRHRLMRDAVSALLLPLERQELARRTAESLTGPTAELDEDHLRLAASLYEQAGQPTQASELLVRAAQAAVHRGALQAAEAYLDRAMFLVRSMPNAVGDVLIERLSVLTLAGRADEAYRLGLEALSGVSGEQRHQLIIGCARAAVTADLHVEASRLLLELGHSDDPAVRVLRAHAAIAAHEPEEAAALAQSAVGAALAENRIDLACEAWELVGRARRRWDLDAAETAYSEARALATAHGLRAWQVRALAELGTVDLFRTADHERFREARELAEECGMAGTLAVLDLHIGACIATKHGMVPAYPTFAAAEARARRLRLTGVRAAVLIFVAHCMVHAGGAPLGDGGEAPTDAAIDAVIVEAVSLGEASTPVPWAGCTLGVRSWLRGNDAEALAHFENALLPTRALRSQSPTPLWGLWALLRVIQDERAQEALDELVNAGLLGHLGNAAALQYGRAILALRSGQPADDLLAAADRVLDPTPFWRNLLRTMIAPSLAGLGVGVVEGWLREADAYFGEARERALQRRARDALRALGASAPRSRSGSVPPRLAALGITTREAEVLGLVTQGLTNAEIGSRLFLSTRTVESHVANLLMKCSCRSRSELAGVG